MLHFIDQINQAWLSVKSAMRIDESSILILWQIVASL